jgi:hypothetical protein
MTRFKALLAKSSKFPDSPAHSENFLGHTSAVLDFSSLLTTRLADPLQSLFELINPTQISEKSFAGSCLATRLGQGQRSLSGYDQGWEV